MNHTQETMDLIKKGYTQANSGINAIDLELPAKTLIPQNTPLVNMITRVTNGKGTEATWKAFVSYNKDGVTAGLAEGARGSEIDHEVKTYFAEYKGLGLTDSYTWEADYAAEPLENLKARIAAGLIVSLKEQEELTDLAGNTSVPLGKTPTPTVAVLTTGGSLAPSTAHEVVAVALGQRAFHRYVAANLATVKMVARIAQKDQGSGAVIQVSNGVAQMSDAVSVNTTSDATCSLSASVAAVPGAYGYAWFVNGKLTAITAVNAVVIKVAGTNTATVLADFSGDNSTDELVYDGIITQIVKPGSGAYVKAHQGPLTPNGTDGIAEIDEALESFFSQHTLSPDLMIVSPSVYKHINAVLKDKLVLQNGLNGINGFVAGSGVNSYLNSLTGTTIKIMVHPKAAPGSIVFYSTSVPYVNSGIVAPIVKKLRREYHQVDYALNKRANEMGVYVDGVLQIYTPFAFGMIYNITA